MWGKSQLGVSAIGTLYLGGDMLPNDVHVYDSLASAKAVHSTE